MGPLRDHASLLPAAGLRGRLTPSLHPYLQRSQGMSVPSHAASTHLTGVVSALGEQPAFHPGDPVRILTRSPVGHYRMPIYLRGKVGSVEAIVEPAGVDNEEEGFGRNA